MSANPEHFMQMQMQLQYQMQLQQMQQQGGGVLADMMAVQSNMSSNPYAGMMHNPYFTNFAMHMQGMPPPAGVAPSMQMPVLQMPGIMATGPTIPNTSSQQLDGSVSGSGAVPSGIALIKVEGANSSLPTKPQHLPQQQFDAAAGSYPFYPYMPLVNPYMYMGMGMPQIGDPSYDPFKGKYHGMGMGMGMPNYGMGTFASPSPAGMNPKPHPPGSSSSQTIAQSNIDKLLPSDVDSANASVLVISWITILEEFDKRYDVVFESCSAKIHLDTSKTIIDGAKGRWRHVTLLDTLIAYGLGRERSKEDCERRRFNQYLALEEAVCFACAEALIWHSTELFSTSGTSNTTNPYMCTVTDIPLAWSTTENLKMDLLHQSSKVKILLTYIINHITLYTYGKCSRGKKGRMPWIFSASSGWCLRSDSTYSSQVLSTGYIINTMSTTPATPIAIEATETSLRRRMQLSSISARQ